MNENLIIYATLNRKAEYYAPEKCAVRKVIEFGAHEFRELRCNLGKPNYIIKQNAEMMGYYNGAFNCILFLNSDGKDGILVNSEGADYARYSQYIPNARDIIAVHEQTLIFGELKNRMDNCIDGWLEHFKNENKFDIPLTDLVDEVDFGEMFVDYVSERLSRDSTIENCEMTSNFLEITKRELVETRLYCPLRFEMDSEDGIGSPFEIDSANYIDYDYEINEHIREDINFDEKAVERGLAAYFHDENLDKKVYSAVPRVETRNGDIYGVITVKSYGELDKTELIDLTNELVGQLADGWGEGFEQRGIRLDGDEVFISFWNGDDDYFLKPESKVFPEQETNQTMGGIS